MIPSFSYLSLARIGWQKAWREKVLICLQLITYAILILIFSSIFLITPFEELPGSIALNATVMIWYIIITELVTVCGGSHNFQEIRNEVLNGQFSSSLQRPKSYVSIKLCTMAGNNVVRVFIFILCGILMGVCFTHIFPYSWLQILFLITSIYVATVIYSTIYCTLGLIEVWGPYARPAMWISQKFTFLLGGLILPLKLYPDWLQSIVWFTPFPSLLNIPGKIVFEPSAFEMCIGLVMQLFWLSIIVALCFIVQHQAYEKIIRTGG